MLRKEQNNEHVVGRIAVPAVRPAVRVMGECR
jgi:hypothetical protein